MIFNMSVLEYFYLDHHKICKNGIKKKKNLKSIDFDEKRP